MKRNQISNLISKIEVTYYNVESIKSQIIKENKNKSGVYIWTNLLSGKISVGSSGNLAIRLKNYLTYSHISDPKRSYSLIYKALVKYGYSNFKLEILEYVSEESCLAREQYYLDLFQPEYNILKIAGSSKGYKHTKDNLKKLQLFLKTHNEKKRLSVELTDINTNEISKYESILATAAALKTNEKNVRYAEKVNKLLLNRYIVKIIRKP